MESNNRQHEIQQDIENFQGKSHYPVHDTPLLPIKSQVSPALSGLRQSV
jgi:hypothetical protein